jgi:hypothetical protein
MENSRRKRGGGTGPEGKLCRKGLVPGKKYESERNKLFDEKSRVGLGSCRNNKGTITVIYNTKNTGNPKS